MKTKIITSIIAMALITPAMAAVDIPKEGSSTCDSSTLKSSSGNVALEADWSANTINIAWDGNGGSTPSGGASTCTYDSTFNLPTAPSRTGYTFAGWTVAAAQQCDFSGLASVIGYATYETDYNATTGQNATWWIDIASSHWETDDNDNDFEVVDTVYGRISGISKCIADKVNPDSTTPGAYCWCKATSYTQYSDNSSCAVVPSEWVYDFIDEGMDVRSCEEGCAGFCIDFLRNNREFGLSMLGLSN